MLFNLGVVTLIISLAGSVMAAPFGGNPALMVRKRVGYPRTSEAIAQGAVTTIVAASGDASKFKGLNSPRFKGLNAAFAEDTAANVPVPFPTLDLPSF
ncbi:hypothetical protein C8R44DRAFT_865427 [Mycena epipterygia]|nr:hypothetical protein C8R44DRAFT_865427 [Mycena epipterygia]